MKVEDIVISSNGNWIKDYKVVNHFKATEGCKCIPYKVDTLVDGTKRVYVTMLEGKYEHQTILLSPDNLEEV